MLLVSYEIIFRIEIGIYLWAEKPQKLPSKPDCKQRNIVPLIVYFNNY